MSDTATETLVCPKCQGAMRSYERSGVTVDQCSECRGVFLDRGELERLMEAEDAHYGTAEVVQVSGGEHGRGGGGGHHGGGGGHGGGQRGGRRRGFLGELFD